MEPGVDGGAKAAGLRVVRVDVVLALHIVVRELEQAADRIAEDRAATMSDVHRTSRVDACELDLQLLSLPDVYRPITRACCCDLPDQRLQPLGREPEVHVAADDLDLRRRVRNLDGLGQPASDLLRRLFEDPGQLHPGGARILASLRRLGAPQLEVREVAVDSNGARRLSQGLVKLLADAAGHEQVGCWPVSVTCAWFDAPPRE